MTDTPADASTLHTGEFRTTSGDYFGILLSEWLPRYGWTLFIPILATAAVGCVLHDERWLLVALMLVFIVAPMVMSFLYTYYMLTPEARRAVLCKRVEITPGRDIRLIYVADDNSYMRDDKVDATDADKSSALRDDSVRLPAPETIAWSEVVRVRRTARYLVYFIRGECMQFILVPRSAIKLS